MTTLFEKFLTINDSPDRIPFSINNYSPKEIENAKKCVAIHESAVKKLNKSDIIKLVCECEQPSIRKSMPDYCQVCNRDTK